MRKAGFTLIELLVVVSIIAVLVAILLPALAKARLNARSVVCLSNQQSIAKALIMYTVQNFDALPVLNESPSITAVKGSRTTPLILRDEKLLPIINDRGGVWRCPLDARDYKPHFLAWYYYREGGPGDPSLASDDGFKGSYSGNAVYRQWSSRCPYSGWDENGQTFHPKQLSKAANPSRTFMFYDSCWDWDAEAFSPYQLFYSWATVEYYQGFGQATYPQLRRHKPGNFGPYGNMGFLDGHAQAGVDYLKTCCGEDYSEDPSKSVQWWSFTGE